VKTFCYFERDLKLKKRDRIENDGISSTKNSGKFNKFFFCKESLNF